MLQGKQKEEKNDSFRFYYTDPDLLQCTNPDYDIERDKIKNEKL